MDLFFFFLCIHSVLSHNADDSYKTIAYNYSLLLYYLQHFTIIVYHLNVHIHSYGYVICNYIWHMGSQNYFMQLFTIIAYHIPSWYVICNLHATDGSLNYELISRAPFLYIFFRLRLRISFLLKCHCSVQGGELFIYEVLYFWTCLRTHTICVTVRPIISLQNWNLLFI